jgi:hypothetical protein
VRLWDTGVGEHGLQDFVAFFVNFGVHGANIFHIAFCAPYLGVDAKILECILSNVYILIAVLFRQSSKVLVSDVLPSYKRVLDVVVCGTDRDEAQDIVKLKLAVEL